CARGGEAAIVRCNDAFTANHAGEALDALRYQLRMLDQADAMGDNPGNEELVVGQAHLLPELPLMLVPRIGGFEGVTADLELQEQVDEVAQLQIMDTRRHIGAVASVKAHAVRRDAPQRVIDDLPGPG